MWDVALYETFGRERVRPSADLAERLAGQTFGRIFDAGCGSGMSTAVLARMWPDARITGADLSPEMLAAARAALPRVRFVGRDCGQPFADLGPFDLVFSNALLQWLPDPAAFIDNAFAALSAGGVLAAQIPLFDEMPAAACLAAVAERAGLNGKSRFSLLSYGRYYDILTRYARSVDMWVTEYCHVMKDAADICRFLSGTALRPYFDDLSAGEREAFMESLTGHLAAAYPAQADGKTLFPFRRLFFVAEKDGSIR